MASNITVNKNSSKKRKLSELEGFSVDRTYYNEVARRLQSTNFDETVNLLSSGKYIDSETLKRHKDRLKQYKSDLEFFNQTQKLMSKDYDESNYIESSKSLENLSKAIHERESVFSKFKNEFEYNDAVKLGELYDMPSADILPHLNNPEVEAKRKNLVSKQTELEKQLREFGASGNKGVGAQKKQAISKELNDIRKQIQDLDKTNGIAYTTSGGQNITWKSLYDQKKQEEDFNNLYGEISSTEDWHESIKKGAEYQNPSKDKAEAKVIVFGKEMGGTKSPINKVSYFEKYGKEIAFGEANGGGSSVVHSRIGEMTKREKEIYNYYFGRGEYDKAEEYLNSLESTLQDRLESQQTENIVRLAEEHPIIASGLSVGFSIGSGAEAIKDGIKYLGTGELDTNHGAELSSAIRGTVSSKVDWEVGEWDVFDFLYGTGMSMIDSATAMATFGVGGGVALGLSAAAQGTNDAIDRGMSKGQAFMSGVASGIFEGFFETWSIGAFGDLTKNLKRADFRNLAKYVGKNMWNNAKEEFLTEIANITYDTLINGDFSQYETAIRQYMSVGLSESEAKKKVATELGVQVAEAAGSGALMGFGFGAGGSVKAAHNIAQSGRVIKDSGQTRNLVDLGKSLGEGAEASKYADKITDKSRGLAIGNLLGMVADGIPNANKMDMIKAFEEKGYNTREANMLVNKMFEQGLDSVANIQGVRSPAQDYTDVLNDPNSTISQRNEAYEGILRGVAENRLQKAMGKAVKTKSAVASQKALTEEQGKSIAQEENPIESKFESNAEGKDFDTKSGRIIESKKLVSSAKDNMAFEVTYEDGTTEKVNANDISFANDGEALVYSAVMDMNVPVGVAETLINGYKGNDVKSAATYVNGMREAFTFGQYNQEADLNNGQYASQLTDEQKNNAYKLGQIYAKEKAEADEKAIQGESKPTNIKKQEGKVHFEGDKLSLKSVQDVSLESLNVLGKALGKDFHIYESYKDANGKRVYKDANGEIKSAPNGFYQQLDGSIWIDLNAGNSGQGTMLYTVAHELTHFIKQWSPTKFKALADFLVEQYGKEGVSVADLVREQQGKAKRHGRNISYDVAFEEMVADSMEAMLTDGKVIKELAKKDKGLFNKIKSWIDNLLRRLNKEYKNYSPESTEGQMLLEMTEAFKESQKLFADALTDASDNYQVNKGQKNTTTEGDVKLQARELQRKDATTLKEEELTSLLEFAKDKMLSDDTYIPVRINTPQILIAFAKEFGHTLENHPLAMQVYKARQALSNEENWDGDYKDKPHDLLPEEVIGIIRAMNNPSHLVFQTENERFAEIVKFEKDGSKEKAYAIVDFSDVNKNPDLMNGYKGGKYNILVTVYPSEDSADLKKYLSNKNHKVLTGEQMKKKGISQGSYGGNTPSLLNDSPFFEDSIPQTSKKSQEKLSARDTDTFTRIHEMQIELNELRKTLTEMQNSEDFKAAHDKLSEAIDNENVDEGIKIYKEWQEKSGYAELSQRRDTLQLELENLRKSFNEKIADKALKEEKEAIAKSGLSEADYFRKQAVKEFGYTPYFYDAGYITPNGKMLNFSGEKGKHYGTRGQDHRAIGIIYANTEGTQAMVKFMNEGNIRLMPESPGFDIYTQAEPTKEQYGTIRRFIYEYAKEGFFNVDISDESGKVIGSLVYENNINPTRIINDIKNYYATGEIRQQSEVDKFRYSDRDSEGHKLSTEQSEYFKDSKIRDKKGRLLAVYHGTKNAGFTKFTKSDEIGYFFAKSLKTAQTYSGDSKVIYAPDKNSPEISGAANYKSYLNIKKPYIIDGKGANWNGLESTGEQVDLSIKSYKWSDDGKGLAKIQFKYGGKKYTQTVQNATEFENFIAKHLNPEMAQSFAFAMNSVVDENGKGEFSVPIAWDFKKNSYAEAKSTRDIVRRAYNSHWDYDGVIFKNVVDSGNGNNIKADDLYVAFYPNQIKSVNNTTPTTDADIRYSDRDSKGNELSKEQQEYFKDSKVRDENGNLLVVYHGTRKADFTVFKRNVNFFTDSEEMADSYAPNGELYKGYLNIANPFIVDANGEKWSKIPVDDSIKNLLLKYGAGVFKENGKWRTTPADIASAIQDGIDDGEFDYDGVIIKNVDDTGSYYKGKDNTIATDYISFNSNQFKNIDNKNPSTDPDIRYSERDYAPTFYSQMGKVVEGVKQEKLGANSVVNLLRGKGVKAEEIRWSGIVPFLEGKKSVTKQELLDFITGSMLQIGEQMSSNDIDLRYDSSNHTYNLYDKDGNIINKYTYNDFMGGYVSENDDEIYTNSTDIEDAAREEYGSMSSPRWADYKLDGGSNYREIVFTLPNSSYSNQMMKVHWGDEAEGVLVHARIQDFDVNGKKMLFIEEIQSDWHNEGHKQGYESGITTEEREEFNKLEKTIDALNEQYEVVNKEKGTLDVDYFKGEKMSFDKYSKKSAALIEKLDEIVENLNYIVEKREKLYSKFKNAVPDAPFKDNYHEFVLKRLIRMAAEQGYDSIGWTTAKTQDERWNDHQAHEDGKGVSGNLVGYTIEYDQEMPKFLRKYGRQWGAKVDKTKVTTRNLSTEEEMELAFIDDMMSDFERDFTRGNVEVWSMDITDSMKNSVLYEGQVLYSERDTDSVSTRSLLANALEGAAQNDIEKNKLAQYKEKIALIEAEQNKLHELREKLFTKGISGAERRKIQDEATQTANRINTYDRQLFNLESTTALKNVLTREKELARKRQKQKDNENLRAYKEKVAETTRELLKKNRESRQKAIEGRTKTEMRHKVKKVVNDLNQLLLNPTKERHIPEEMRIAVAEALALVNMDTVDADTRVARYNELIAKEKNPDVIASLTETRDRILEQGNKLGEKLAKLKDAYGMVRDSADDSLKSMYDDVIYNKIESVQKKVGKTPLRSMTLEQLESVYELYKMVLTTVRDSNKAFAENIKMTRQALGSNTFVEIKENNKSRDRIRFESIENFGWKNLKPMQAMKTIGSGILQKLWNNILYGQEVFAQDYDEAVKFAKEMKEKYGYNKWNLDKLYSFETKSGKVMKINLEQMMSVYAYSKRKQADEHIEFGGILLNESIIKEKKHGRTVEVKVNDSTAYRLDKRQVGEIITTLEKKFPGAISFVDEMQKYLSETMGEKGNEVSMKMYGIKLFKEEHYFPLKSSKDFMEAANAKLKGDVKIKNKGMTKSTVEHASNPIVLENFLDVWGNHINEMAMYHGLVLPLEDFSRTLNYGFKADDKLNTDAESVRTALRSAFGESADNYLNELLKAINGGVLHDSSTEFADRMISKFKKAKVMASLSVIVQQPTAIIRAMGIIEPKYFVAQNFHHKQTWEELKKYCPTAIIKETGSFDTNMGRTIVDMVKEDRKFTEKVGDVLGKAPAWMDEMGWNMIWRALKNKVATEQKLSGEELLKECGRQMTLIINETQVYDSVMSRNELMRSKSAFTKMATSFMAEPTTVANMIYGAVLDFKRGKKSIAGKTVAAVISSVVINGLVSSLVYAFRDDDEEKTWLEKYLSSATTEVIDGFNPLTYIPYVKDAYSLFQGYDVERTDMAIIGDVVDAIEDFYNVLDPEAYEGMSSGEIAKHIYENAKPLLTSICDMFGLPVGNILRDAEAIIVNDNLPMSKTSGEGIGLAAKEGWLNSSPKIVQKFVDDEKYHKLYLIANNGDTAYVKTEVNEMVAEKFDSYKEEEDNSFQAEKKAKQSVRSSFTGVYRDEYKKAYKNKDAEEMNRIRKFLYATGLWNSLSELDSLLAKWRKED